MEPHLAGGRSVSDERDRFVGLQMSPINFVDEGVEPLLEMLANRFGINALMIGTVSWLGLKAGRRVSHALEGWPDHGAQDTKPLRGGSYLTPHPEYYAQTPLKDVRARDEELEGVDILETVLPHAHARGIRVYADLMEPMFNYLGHGSSRSVDVPNLPQLLQVDALGRITSEPCINNPGYRNWLHGLVEDHCRSYDLDGIMWCNERRSPLDAALLGKTPHCFCVHCTSLAAQEGIDVERARAAALSVWELIDAVRAGAGLGDGALVEFLRVLYRNPEVLLWERFWVERNRALDSELYGIVKFCDASIEFGLNVWNRNHLNPWRKAQWPWDQQAQWADWVKPIVYQHQSGGIFHDEWAPLIAGVFRDLDPTQVTELAKAILGIDEASWEQVVQVGFDPDTYVFGQCRDTVEALDGRIPVYMGIGVDAPRSREDQAACTADIVRRSVLATYRAGGSGVIFGPAYSGMNLTTLDGGAAALQELDLLATLAAR
jgi:hypothetical protein